MTAMPDGVIAAKLIEDTAREMARWEIVAWQEIPAAVEATDDGGQVTLQLSERFQALIDSVAMQQGL
ncbi:MAG TPA: hypothetical protein VFQ62_18040, partial [Methylomirabilota bacterium]|nr:hypothetical protein [Methylomirabilota bacterium]